MSEEQSIASTSRPGSPIPPLPDFTSSKPYRFTWDVSTRRPGPASVSGTSEGRGDYFAYKPNLGQFNFSSASLATGVIPSEWSSAKHGFNAISTLVNSPHKRSAPPKAHAPVPPVIPAQLPRVKRKDFDPYLKAVTPEWEQFERNLQVSRDATLQGDSFASRLAQIDDEEPQSPRTPRVFSGTPLPPLTSVPSIFFNESFDLSDPRTFATVAEQREGEEDTLDPASLSHSLPLLERLSHYADTIELHLIREVSIRSSSFFAALTNLNELQTESAQCLERIRMLRGMLKEVDENGAKKGLQIIQREAKLRNIEDVAREVDSVQNIVEMCSLARSLASSNERETALGMIDELNRLWEPETPVHYSQKFRSSAASQQPTLSVVPESPSEGDSARPPPQNARIPLSSLNAFASLPDHLRKLTMDISDSLSAEFISVLKTDLYTMLTAEKGSSEDLHETERRTSLKDRLTPLIRGLIRTNRIRDSITQWREAALIEIRTQMKKHFPSTSDLDEEQTSPRSSAEKGSTLRSNLQSLTHPEFMKLLRSVYITLLSGIEALQFQNSVVSQALTSLSEQNTTSDLSAVQLDLEDILSSATEMVHARSSKILNLRADQHATLDLLSFFELFTETWDFVIKTETICRRMVVGLRGSIVSQAKAFLQSTHQARITQSAKLVEEEQWSAVDVPSVAQMQTNMIVDSAMRDPPGFIIRPGEGSGSSTTNGSAGSTKQLAIEDRSFFAVSATLQMIDLLVDYLKIITNLPLLTTDAVGRIIEFLKAFNSRTCQVVLGAGAMRSAGLKNITAKHLALASQSLSIVVALIPYIRECFRRHLNPKQAVMLVEFDKLKRDYQEHQQEIHTKLIAIMGDRINTHCRTLAAIDWNVPRDTVDDYMVVLVKETMTLHKVLSRYLQHSVLEEIMSQVLASVNHNLSEEFSKIELPTEEAKERMMRDARYLNAQLSSLKGIKAPTGMLEVVVGEKRIRGSIPPQSPQPPPTPSPAPPSEPTPQVKQTHHTAFESANERLRGIFHRAATLDSKKPLPRPRTPTLPAAPLRGQATPEEKPKPAPIAEESSRTPPPPTPEKDSSLVPPPRSVTPAPFPELPQSPSPEKGLFETVPRIDGATDRVVEDSGQGSPGSTLNEDGSSVTLTQSPEQKQDELPPVEG